MGAVWTEDGNQVTALVHDEFHGQDFIGSPQAQQYCPMSQSDWKLPYCQYWNIIGATSSNGGSKFTPSGANVIVTPYQYDVSHYTTLQGMVAQTNINQSPLDNNYYILAQNYAGTSGGQGVCLFRTSDPTDFTSWKGWDGKDFTVSMAQNPYTSKIPNPQSSTCTGLPSIVGISIDSLSYDTIHKIFILFGTTTAWPTGTEETESAFVYLTSPDLINWSQPGLLMPIEWFNQWFATSGSTGESYPSLLDPSMGSQRRNFDQIGTTPYLYYVRLNPISFNNHTHNRDLVRVPLEITSE